MESLYRIDSIDDFETVSQEVLSHLYAGQSSSKYLEADVIELAKHDLKNIISECNFEMHEVATYLNSKGWPPEKVKCLLNLLEKNKSELLCAALNYYKSNYGENLVDFDWVVKFVFGTSELKTLKYPLLQLIMSTMDKNGIHAKVMYDVNKDMLLKLISVLENI